MLDFGMGFVRRGKDAGRARARRSPLLRPTLDGLEARDLMTVDLSSTPIQAKVNATTGLIPIATIGAFPALGATLTPKSPGTAQISWGDGTSSTAIVQVNLIYNDLNYFSMGRYGGPVQDNGAILGAHTYARSGTYPISVTLTDSTGQMFATATTATVTGKSGAGFGITPTGPLTATAGTTTALTPVATFTDQTPKLLKASAYKAQITWGDGGQSAGVVKVIPSGRTGGKSLATIEVLGAHAFVAAFETSEYQAGLTVSLSRAGAKTSTTTVADVTGAGDSNLNAITALSTAPLTVQRGRASGSLTVARFQGVTLGGLPNASDYTAEIAWGDGTTSAGTVRIVSGVTVYSTSALVYDPSQSASTASNFILQVSGRHTYHKPGTESVVTTLPDEGLTTTATTVLKVR